MARQDEIWLIESPVSQVEGEVIAYSVNFLGANDVANPAVVVYRNKTDITSSVMISGDSHVVSGNVVTMKKITALAGHGDSAYVVFITATVDGNTEGRKLHIDVLSPSEEQV